MSPPTAISCPGCGAENPLRNPGIVSLVCKACAIVITREGATAKAGRESLLAPASSGITVGVTGRIRGRATEVVGRIRMEHSRGAWDEWYCEDARGQPVWLVEEEGRFRLEKTITDALPSGIGSAAVGETFRILGQQFQVLETGKATLAGGEGQLPRGFSPGEQIRTVELSAVQGKEKLSIEVSGDTVEGFMGHPISRASVDFPKAWRPAAVKEEAATINCSGCGSALDIRPLPEPVKTLTCRYCGSVHALHGDETSLLGKNTSRDDFHLLVGARGILKGTNYEVVGRLVYESFELDDGRWSTAPSTGHEYLLVDDAGDFVTLEVGEEGVALVRKTGQVPALQKVMGLGWGNRYTHPNGRTYRMYERGRSQLVYVDGALPWVAKLGDACDFVDMIDMPGVWSDRIPERLSVEWATTDEGDAHEVEAFVARDLSPALLASAFEGGVAPRVFRRVLEPTPRSPALTRFGLIWAVLALCLMAITGIVTNGSGDEIGRVSVKASVSSPPPEYSKPFTLEDGALVAVRINSNTNNSWLYAEVDLVDAGSGESLGFVGREVSYYHGVEGGESWSEGSRKWRETYIVPKGGRYKLRVELSEAERKGLEVTATISTVWLDKRWPFRMGWFLFGFGVLWNLWALTGRKNLWPSDD